MWPGLSLLQRILRRRKQLKILELFGTVDFDPDFDYKQMRMLDRIPNNEFDLE